jgi:hypothetical protein
VCYSQKDSLDTYDQTKALEFFIGLGGAYNDYKNLNATLEDASLPTVGKFSFTPVIEANLRHKNFIIGLNGGIGFSERRPDNYNVMLLNFLQELHAGYYVVNSNDFHLAPQVGIGFFSSALNLEQRDNINDFNQLLEDKNAVSINQVQGILDFCLRFELANFTKPKSRAANFKLGYRYGLSKRGWGIDYNTSTVENSPEDRINQFYATASVGISLLKPQPYKP